MRTRPSHRSRSLRRSTAILVACGWLVVAAGFVLLALRYPRLPAQLPLYRSLSTGAALRLAPKSWLALLRVPLMGAMHLLLATLLALRAEHAAAEGWRRFWLGMALTAAVKTLLESLDYATLGPSATASPLLLAATLAVVLAFAAWAVNLWLRGRLERWPPLGPATSVAVTLAFALYVALATWPTWRR